MLCSATQLVPLPGGLVKLVEAREPVAQGLPFCKKLIENFCTAAAFSPKAKDGALNGFADAGSISAWAKEAAQICVSYSYVQGTKLGNGTYLNPKDNASRQEAMTMIQRATK